ncbi:MAG TPA: DHHA1 domain-containing protein [Pyrinomonadaceae bacterium]|nr:DHHA1 domain-containing protein [Pyrinomonadaceae bacterium]
MSITERLYYKDSHLTDFEAQVVEVTDRVSGWTGVTLDRTAFYPTGGGQPSDTGMLAGSRVVECLDREDEGVLHLIQGRTPQVGETVRCHVDWPRRLDHIQQHTGQHILSQAFIHLFQAETRSFRMMTEASEIDLALDDATDERIHRAVELANRVIWENRPIHVREVTQEEAASLPLRKDSERDGLLRLIEIEDYDLSPCGGTHASRTGEVGIICVRSWERAKGLVRIEFLAGGRVAQDYRRVNQSARTVATLFSAGRDESADSATRLIEENKSLHRRMRSLEEIAARAEAHELLSQAEALGDHARLIKHIFEGKSADELRQLALHLSRQPNTIALLASTDAEGARLVFARSEDAPGNMSELMREACQQLEGRGGGRPEMAQGGGRATQHLPDIIEAAAKKLHESHH